MVKDSDRNREVGLDLVIPIYNEAAMIDPLFERLSQVFSKDALKLHGISLLRFILIDDGSTDESARMIGEKIQNGAPAVLLRLSRNFGHQNAISAGFRHTSHDVVAIIDADLQDPPEIILHMLKRWREGYDVVYGERRARKENFLKVFSYWLYYRILSFFSEIPVPLDSGDFSLLDRKVVEAMNALPETLRFPRGLRAWVGFRQAALPYERESRRAGSSKYTFRKLYYLATDGLASMSIRPLKAAQFASFIFAGLALLFSFFLLARFNRIASRDDSTIWFLMICLVVSLAAFVNLFCIYVLSAYVGRTYLEVKRRPSYVIMEVIGDRDGHRAGP